MEDNKRPWSPPQIIWSALIATVVWSAIGFSWFGYGFNWTTQGGAKQLQAMAVKEQLATICVGQARSAPDAPAVLQQLAKLSTWEQHKFVESARWATMPGSDSPRGGVAAMCAQMLRET